jgi:hypothetical protein
MLELLTLYPTHLKTPNLKIYKGFSTLLHFSYINGKNSRKLVAVNIASKQIWHRSTTSISSNNSSLEFKDELKLSFEEEVFEKSICEN